MEKARWTTLSAALFVLICFFLPWVQVSCIGMKDAASGLDLARGGDRALWLIPILMILALAMGLTRFIWERMPALFALSGMSGGLICAWLMYYERNHTRPALSLTSTFWTTWYWLGLLASLVVSGAALWFYASRSRAP
jgi:hypothetical protein